MTDGQLFSLAQFTYACGLLLVFLPSLRTKKTAPQQTLAPALPWALRGFVCLTLSMGMNIRLFRLLILLCACALAGLITIMAGPVAFIGPAIPHMTRMIFPTSDNRILIPATMLMGAPIVISVLMKKKVQL